MDKLVKGIDSGVPDSSPELLKILLFQSVRIGLGCALNQEAEIQGGEKLGLQF